MKKVLLFLFIALPSISLAQCISCIWNSEYPYYTFESPTINYDCYFHRDTADTVNTWQIGTSQKTVFTHNAYSGTRVIATDTVNSYKPNDTSSFIIAHRAFSAIVDWNWFAVDGYYYVNSDTLTDYGFIEFSPDNGITWFNLMTDTTGLANWALWPEGKPVFSGNSFGWRNFSCTLVLDKISHAINYDDTVKFRFNFISDTADTHKDGLMFDDIYIFDIAENVPTLTNATHIISLFPNPATNSIHVQSPTNTTQKRIHLLNYTGTLIKEINNFAGNEIDVSALPPGIYVLKYADEQFVDAVPFYIQR